jgi:hypothetical protein
MYVYIYIQSKHVCHFMCTTPADFCAPWEVREIRPPRTFATDGTAAAFAAWVERCCLWRRSTMHQLADKLSSSPGKQYNCFIPKMELLPSTPPTDIDIESDILSDILSWPLLWHSICHILGHLIWHWKLLRISTCQRLRSMNWFFSHFDYLCGMWIHINTGICLFNLLYVSRRTHCRSPVATLIATARISSPRDLTLPLFICNSPERHT